MMSDSSGRGAALSHAFRCSVPALTCLILGACASFDLSYYEPLIPIFDPEVAPSECAQLARTLSDGIADSYTENFSGDGADEIGVAIGAGVNEARIRNSIRKRCLEKAKAAAQAGRNMA